MNQRSQTLVYTNSSDLSYFTGALLGDGCLYRGNYAYQSSITSEDYDFCEMCSNIIEQIFAKRGRIKTIYKDGKVSYHQFVVCSKEIFEFFDQVTCSKSVIPTYVYNNDTTVKGFVQGLMDSDGWISKAHASDGYIRYRVGFKNISKWTKPFRIMFEGLGVRTGKLRKQSNCRSVKEAYTFSINTSDYCNKVGFRILRKIKMQEEFLDVQSKKNN